MTELSLALVLFSGLTHASWNLLLKNSHNQEVFIWWLKITISVMLAPIAVILIWNDGIESTGWWFILGTSLIHILYYLFLSRSYMHADLSLVYPLARGTGPVLIAFLGITLLGETISEYPKSWFVEAKISKTFNVDLNYFQIRAGLNLIECKFLYL